MQWFGGRENHSSATTIEDKMSLSSVLNILIGCREDDAGGVIAFRSAAVGVMS